MARKRVVIVGGVAGGASCAARLRRLDEDAGIVILERGYYVSFAHCGMPYFVGNVIPEESKLLLASPDLFRERFNIEVRLRNEVISIDRQSREVVVREVDSEREYREPYDALVLSPGAAPIRPALPGVDLPGIFTLRSLPDSEDIRDWIDAKKPRRAVVVGGGFIGLEMAENLVHRGMEVTIIDVADQLVATQSGAAFDAGLVVLSIGVRPESRLARAAGLEIGDRGGIRVDSRMLTSDPYIWAVGDAVEVKNRITGKWEWIPLAGPANRQGRVAADVVCGRNSRFSSVQGTAICGFFG